MKEIYNKRRSSSPHKTQTKKYRMKHVFLLSISMVFILLGCTLPAPEATEASPPTNTSVPPTNTSLPPTNTPIPPTETPVPTPTYVPGEVVYSTDFSDIDSKWKVETEANTYDADGNPLFAEGEYELEHQDDGLLVTLLPSTDLQRFTLLYTADDLPSDYTLNLTAEKVKGNNYDEIGISCRVSGYDAYDFSIETSGYWFIYSWALGEEIPNRSGSTAINTGMTTNTLGLTCKGSHYTLLVNDKVLIEFENDGISDGTVKVVITSFSNVPLSVLLKEFVISIPE